MVNKTLVLSIGFVVCGSLLFVYGYAVVYSIANDPIGAGFGGPVPTYYYFENISGGTPLVSLGITVAAAGFLIAFHDWRRVRPLTR